MYESKQRTRCPALSQPTPHGTSATRSFTHINSLFITSEEFPEENYYSILTVTLKIYKSLTTRGKQGTLSDQYQRWNKSWTWREFQRPSWWLNPSFATNLAGSVHWYSPLRPFLQRKSWGRSAETRRGKAGNSHCANCRKP